MLSFKKLDGVGPVDNRPSTDKLNNKKNKKKHWTCNTWRVTFGVGGGIMLEDSSSLPIIIDVFTQFSFYSLKCSGLNSTLC